VHERIQPDLHKQWRPLEPPPFFRRKEEEEKNGEEEENEG